MQIYERFFFQSIYVIKEHFKSVSIKRIMSRDKSTERGKKRSKSLQRIAKLYGAVVGDKVDEFKEFSIEEIETIVLTNV